MRLRDALPETIVTERLRLRLPVASDREALVEGANNWKIVEPTATLPFPYLAEHAEALIAHFAHKPEQRPYAIARSDDDRLMGIIGLKFAEDHPPELGYWVADKYWRKGFAPEAVAGLLKAAARAGIETVRARVLASNPASARVLEKTGFDIIERTQSVVERHRGKPLLVLEWRA